MVNFGSISYTTKPVSSVWTIYYNAHTMRITGIQISLTFLYFPYNYTHIRETNNNLEQNNERLEKKYFKIRVNPGPSIGVSSYSLEFWLTPTVEKCHNLTAALLYV